MMKPRKSVKCQEKELSGSKLCIINYITMLALLFEKITDTKSGSYIIKYITMFEVNHG